jgi:cysteine-rich repeat protein
VPSAGELDNPVLRDELRMLPEFLTAACVEPASLEADAGTPEGPSASGCGNGERDNIELCDDGNRVAGDGCSQFCTLETGYKCWRWGWPCHPDFGDPQCSSEACRFGALCVDTAESVYGGYDPVRASCACPPSGALRECPIPDAVGLPRPSRASDCWATAISADGNTVVGGCAFDVPGSSPDLPRAMRAVRWGLDGSAETIFGDASSEADDVSADGSVVVGRSARGAFLWSSGTLRLLGEAFGEPAVLESAALVNGPIIGALSLSLDGGVVAGGEGPAWLWSEATGVRELPAAAAERASGAAGVSPDGSRVLGYEVDANGVHRPLTWAVAEPLVASSPAPDLVGEVVASNADASLLVLDTLAAPPRPGDPSVPRVVLWTPGGSTTLAPDGTARALSSDGRVLVGARTGGSLIVWRLDQDNAVGEPDGHFGPADASGNARVIVGRLRHLQRNDPRIFAAVQWLP